MLEVAQRVVGSGYRITASSGWFRYPSILAALPESAAELATGVISSGHPARRYAYNPIAHHQNGAHPHVPVRCRSPYKLARIDYDGRVYLCHRYAVGSIYDADLLTLWNGFHARTLRGSINRDSQVCHGCDYFNFCINADRIDYGDVAVHTRQGPAILDYNPTTGWPPAMLLPVLRRLRPLIGTRLKGTRARLRQGYLRLRGWSEQASTRVSPPEG